MRVSEYEPYPTPGGVENAIKEAAKKAALLDPALSVQKRIQLEYFDRFLSRVFSEGDCSEWVLKGGTGILARVPSTRSTRDIDLAIHRFSPRQALDDLTRLAAVDLQDHFRFEYVKHTDSIGNDAQPYAEGYRVQFNIFIGLRHKGPLHIDLATGAEATGEITSTIPAAALHLPRLVRNRYRLYPVVDQVADKVCATMTQFKERGSSREKDLVDLVVLASTHDVSGAALRRALITEASRRQLHPIERFVVPASWGAGYAKLSASVPHCSDHRTVGLAEAMVARFIDPALAGACDGKTWSHERLAWE